MEDWKELVVLFFCKKIRVSLAVFITRKTHTFLSVICGVSFFIPAMCIVYVCPVLTSSILISLENVSYIVS